jgi:hypothetical protein
LRLLIILIIVKIVCLLVSKIIMIPKKSLLYSIEKARLILILKIRIEKRWALMTKQILLMIKWKCFFIFSISNSFFPCFRINYGLFYNLFTNLLAWIVWIWSTNYLLERGMRSRSSKWFSWATFSPFKFQFFLFLFIILLNNLFWLFLLFVNHFLLLPLLWHF